MPLIYAIEDDENIRQLLKTALEAFGYQVEAFETAAEGLTALGGETPDLLLLDIMLPDADGVAVLRQLRGDAAFEKLPIMMLTAKSSEIDKVTGLDAGADDYMTKPFNMLELKARIKNIFRRLDNAKGKANLTVAKVDDMTVDFISRSVTIAGREVNLTAKEFDLLQLFISNKGVVFEREKLLELIWKQKGDLRTVDVHIRRLREKIEEEPAHPQYILTKWGVGYYFSNK